MYIKFIYEDNVKKIVFSKEFEQFDFLNKFCIQFFSLVGQSQYFYIDEQDDKILLTSNEDIFLMKYFDQNQKYFSIYIEDEKTYFCYQIQEEIFQTTNYLIEKYSTDIEINDINFKKEQIKLQKDLIQKRFDQCHVNLIVKKSFLLYYTKKLQEETEKELDTMQNELNLKIKNFERNFNENYFSLFIQRPQSFKSENISEFSSSLINDSQDEIFMQKELKTQSCQKSHEKKFFSGANFEVESLKKGNYF